MSCLKTFVWIQFHEWAIQNVFAIFNFTKIAKIHEIAKFNLAKINPVKVYSYERVCYDKLNRLLKKTLKNQNIIQINDKI